MDELMLPGIYNDLSNDAYHAHQAVSKSGLDHIHQSPAHYREYRDNPPEPTPAMLFGTAIHAAILEHDKFAGNYMINPGINKRTKDGKAEWERLMAEGWTILSEEEWAAIQGIKEAVMAHPQAREWIENGQAELSGIYNHPEFDTLVKVRPDLWVPGDGTIVDLKTTTDARPDAFGKAAWNFRYHVQAAFYTDIWRQLVSEPVRRFCFIAVEKAAPYAVAVYEVPYTVISVGRDEYREDLALYAWCLENDEWPAYTQDIMTLQLPGWAMRG